MSLQTGTQVGTATRHIIDPRRLNIVAFYCEGSLIDFDPAILHVSDIREFGNIGFIVDSADNIMSADDLVRLKEVLDYNFELVGKPVVEEGGRKVGKVNSYTVDSESFYIMKLHVRPTFFHSFGQAELLIDRSQIREINDKHIMISKATTRDEQHEQIMPAHIIDNPFRKAPRRMPEAHGASKKKEATNS